jgi:hypothetical protein
LYPGLVITSSTNTFGLNVTENITESFKNSPLDPAGTAPSHPFFTTNFTTNVVSFFQYTFGNLITNSFSTRGLVGTITLKAASSPTSPAGVTGAVQTNVSLSFVNGTFGNFFLLPANLCSVQIITNLLTQVVVTTNPPIATTNTLGGNTTNATVTFIPGSITFATNSTLLYFPVTCPADTVATRQGMGELTFVRRDFDSLLNQFWDPVTNTYIAYALTNGFLVSQQVQRAVTAPDFLITAADINVSMPSGSPFVFSRNVNFDTADTPAGVPGPGTIDTPSTITLNTIAPSFGNTAGGIEDNQSILLIWGSFDGTTNDPIVYPNGTSIVELESELLGPFITTTSLPNGNVGVPYSTSLVGTGGQPPYTWSISAGSALPSGLTNTPDGQITGIPTGPPATYDLSICITDSASNSNNVPFTLTIQQ